MIGKNGNRITTTYYRPTPGHSIGQWNVFRIDGSSVLDVEYADLPDEVRAMITERFAT